MSAYSEYENIDFKELDLLMAALGKIRTKGKVSWEGKILTDSEGLPLFGYQGDNRNLKGINSASYAPLCQIVIPGTGRAGCKNLVGGASNDIGFYKKDGKYIPVISQYDSDYYDKCWMNNLKGEYLKGIVHRNAKKNGYKVKETMVDGKFKMTLTRWT